MTTYEHKVEMSPLNDHKDELKEIRRLANVQPDEGCFGNAIAGCYAAVISGVLWGLSIMVSLIPLTWLFCVRTLTNYERAVVFRLGKFSSVKEEGMHYLMPFLDTWTVIDLRVQTMDIRGQEMLTKESVTVNVNAVVLYHVNNAKANVMTINKARYATSQLAATAIRSVIGESELDDLLAKREKINARLQRYLDAETDSWGLKVTRVEIKDVTLPKAMQRSMGAQAESERERRAKVIAAEGEVQAAPLLLQAAMQLSKNPASLQLRFLDTLREISAEKNSTVVFPLPLEFLTAFQKRSANIQQESKVPLLTPAMS
uniref:Band 7 domain-containing protein n=1 Tax=Lotharella oceanica TaxID=641309 RepID=A0A7S2TXU8_9EUKA